MTYIPAPIAETTDTVTLSRTDWLAMIEALEDAKDHAAAAAHDREVAAGGKIFTIPGEIIRRLIDGDHPVRVWRDHRGLSVRGLAGAAGISSGYLTDIENGRKPGSAEALSRLATALDVPMEELMHKQRD